jgi:hypothetical protein
MVLSFPGGPSFYSRVMMQRVVGFGWLILMTGGLHFPLAQSV